MVFENNWQLKTLENLEKEYWEEPDFGRHRLVVRIHGLRQIPLAELTVEDLRVMIGQNFSLDYLIPLAIKEIQKDPFIEGDLYEGDLLQSVLNVNPAFWVKNKEYYHQINAILESNLQKIIERGVEVGKFKRSLSVY